MVLHLKEKKINRMLPLDIEKLRICAAKAPKNSSAYRARNKLLVLERCGFKCVLCGSNDELTIDHIVKNSSFKQKNARAYSPGLCRVLCVSCHMYKNERPERNPRWRQGIITKR